MKIKKTKYPTVNKTPPILPSINNELPMKRVNNQINLGTRINKNNDQTKQNIKTRITNQKLKIFNKNQDGKILNCFRFCYMVGRRLGAKEINLKKQKYVDIYWTYIIIVYCENKKNKEVLNRANKTDHEK